MATTPALKLDTPVKHLLVDLDDTLLGNRALPLSLAFVRASLGNLKKYGGIRKAASTLIAINKEFSKPDPEKRIDQRVVELFSQRMNVSVEDARKILREGLFVIFPELQKHFYPIQGAKEFLDWAKDHFPLTLATNPVWPPEIVELRVKWAGIDPKIFSFVTHIREMNGCKPTREYYEGILEHQKLKAEDCLLIGNDLKMDLPATQFGIRTFIVGSERKAARIQHSKGKVTGYTGTWADVRALLETGN